MARQREDPTPPAPATPATPAEGGTDAAATTPPVTPKEPEKVHVLDPPYWQSLNPSRTTFYNKNKKADAKSDDKKTIV